MPQVHLPMLWISGKGFDWAVLRVEMGAEAREEREQERGRDQSTRERERAPSNESHK